MLAVPQGGMAATLWAKPVCVGTELWFEVGFEDAPDDFLP